MPARFRPRTMRIDPADHAQRWQVVDQRPGRERRGDAEEREHGPETRHVGDRVAHRRPARGRHAVRVRRDGDRGQLAEIGGHERQDARRQEADDARGEGDEDRQVGAGHRALRRPGRRRGAAGSWPALVASSSRRSPSSTTGIVVKNARCQAASASISRSTTVGTARPDRRALVEDGLHEVARLVAQVAAGSRRTGTRSGRGASCISVRIVGEVWAKAPLVPIGRERPSRDRPPLGGAAAWCADDPSASSVPWGDHPWARYDGVRAPVAQWTERGRPKACVGGSSPSGGAIATQQARRTGRPAASTRWTRARRSGPWP